jgi:type I restriction enzyme S subunit
MGLQTFFDSFELLGDASNGIAKLRELIFDLAVEGKLDAQNSSEERAAESLKRIQAEKQRSVTGGKMKKPNALGIINSKDIPFELPQQWEWVRLSEVCELENGDRSKNYPSRVEFVPYGIPFINAGHLRSGVVCMESMNYISEGRFNLLKSGKVREGDILFCLRGSLGKSALVSGISQGAIASSLVILRLIGDLNRRFVLNYLFSSLAAQMIKRFDNGTAQPNLSSADLGKFLFPLAPLEEQERIVAKVDELMRLCDELEARQQARRQSHLRLINATLAPLNNGASLSPKGFEQASVRLAENFASLYDSPETIGKLRSTILQLAVQGKLVQQDPDDEPAPLLIRRIAVKKAGLVKDKIISASQPLSPITQAEAPFDIPASWVWAKLGDATTSIQIGPFGSLLHKSDYVKNGTPLVNPSHIKSERIVASNDITIDEKKKQRLSNYIMRTGDIVMGRRGEMGKCAVVSEKEDGWLCGTGSLFFRFTDDLFQDYLLKVLTSDYLKNCLLEDSVGSTMNNLNQRVLNNLLVPLPPLEEQKRIVATVNQLMALCDELETKLRQAEADSEKLMNAAVRHVLDTIAGKEKSQSETALALSSG